MNRKLAIRFPRALVATIASCAVLSAGPAFESEPTIRTNPNAAVPLSAILDFEANGPVHSVLSILDGGREWMLSYPPERDPAKGLPVVGMKYGRTHRIQVSIADSAGETAVSTSVLQFSTPEKPNHPTLIPPIRTMVGEPKRMGATFVLLATIDHGGEIVWSYRSDSRISDVEPLKNSNFLFVTTDNRATEIDVLGHRVGHWYASNRPQGETAGIPISTLTMHHEIDELSNGNLLVIGTELSEHANWYTSETDPGAPVFESSRVPIRLQSIERSTSITAARTKSDGASTTGHGSASLEARSGGDHRHQVAVGMASRDAQCPGSPR